MILSSCLLPPSSFPRVPLAVPGWNRATRWRIIGCLISRRIINGADLGKLKSQILTTLGVADALLCGSGSLALELALRRCQVGNDDEVIIPAFCCSAVVPPILALGATPVLADNGDELNVTVETLQAAVTRKTRAIIVPHLFGNPADIQAIVELARAKNLRVINDAAQALGATVEERAVGSFGDYGVLSFGADKICFGLGGGALISPATDALGAAGDSELLGPRAAATLGKLLATLFWRRWRRWTLPVQRMTSMGKRRNPNQAPVVYRSERMANLKAAVARNLMESLHENIMARRARVRAYHELLGGVGRLELIRHRPGSACLTQVIRVFARHRDDDAASRVISALRAGGYEVQGSYVPLHLLSQFDCCVWDRLPKAERVWADLVELPCEPSVSLTNVERIAAIVKRTVGE